MCFFLFLASLSLSPCLQPEVDRWIRCFLVLNNRLVPLAGRAEAGSSRRQHAPCGLQLEMVAPYIPETPVDSHGSDDLTEAQPGRSGGAGSSTSPGAGKGLWPGWVGMWTKRKNSTDNQPRWSRSWVKRRRSSAPGAAGVHLYPGVPPARPEPAARPNLREPGLALTCICSRHTGTLAADNTAGGVTNDLSDEQSQAFFQLFARNSGKSASKSMQRLLRSGVHISAMQKQEVRRLRREVKQERTQRLSRPAYPPPVMPPPAVAGKHTMLLLGFSSAQVTAPRTPFLYVSARSVHFRQHAEQHAASQVPGDCGQHRMPQAALIERGAVVDTGCPD